LRYVVVEPDDYRRGADYPMVVLLHGYGAHMGDLAGLTPTIDRRSYVYALPNAPIPLDLGYGAAGYGWSEPLDGGFDEDGSAEAQVEEFVDEVMKLYQVAPGNIVLGGFSQGGMMAYRHALPRPEVFRGLVALSAQIPDLDDMQALLPPRRDQPVFISHGALDTLIPVEAGRGSCSFLEANGYKPELHEYEMAHQITAEVVSDLAAWLKRVLPSEAGPRPGAPR
jgi:phospholipase/carboxylesterase